MADETPEPSKALTAYFGGNEVRLSLISLITARAATPSELAAALGISPSKVRYHLRKLVEWGLVTRVGESARRGVVEASYEVAGEHLFEEDELKTLSPAEHLRTIATVLWFIEADIRDSLRSGLFYERDDYVTLRVPMRLDEEGWSELTALHNETFREARRIQARSAKRLAASDEEPIVGLSVQLCIELPKDLGSRQVPKNQADR